MSHALTAMQALSSQRLWQRLESLSTFTDPERPWTRRAFSPRFMASRQWLTEQMQQAGLSVRIDSGGNLIGRLEGAQPHAKPIMTGSHSDTVFDGGRYDGILGVLAGIEVAHALRDSNQQLEHPFEVVDFLSEEPSDFGVSCVGSRAMVGALSADMLVQRAPGAGTLAEAITLVGGDPTQLTQPLYSSGDLHAFVELHIEQGPVLECQAIPIGVVTDLVGIRRFRVVITGQPDHSGTTPMDHRKDALVGAAILIQATQQKAIQMNSEQRYVVSTVGYLSVMPNSSNAVPGKVELMLEIRSNEDHVVEHYGEQLFNMLQPELQALGLQLHTESVSHGKPTRFDAEVVDMIEHSAGVLGYPSLRLPSGAGHDAVYLAGIAPAGMVFIPCLNGRSHCPEEGIQLAHMEAGLKVLLQSVQIIDQHVFNQK